MTFTFNDLIAVFTLGLVLGGVIVAIVFDKNYPKSKEHPRASLHPQADYTLMGKTPIIKAEIGSQDIRPAIQPEQIEKRFRPQAITNIKLPIEPIVNLRDQIPDMPLPNRVLLRKIEQQDEILTDLESDKKLRKYGKFYPKD